jgi:hypothetical protein
MTDTSLLVLKEQFYDVLYQNLYDENKLVDGSVFKQLLWSWSNQILEYLDSASVSSEKINPLVLNELIEKGFIRGGSEFSKYVLTAKGVWEIEALLEKIDSQSLLDYIDKSKYFMKFGGNLSNKEKVVILSLIALRAFYEKTPLNRKNGTRSLDNINEVMNKSINFLQENIKDFNLKLSEDAREGPVNSIFARLRDLPKNTRGLYKLESHKSWLDIYSEEENRVSEEKLAYLLWKVFGGNLSFEKQNIINRFCNDILYDHKNYVYNSKEIEDFIFSDIAYQNTISNSLFMIAENKERWEKNDKSKKKLAT